MQLRDPHKRTSVPSSAAPTSQVFVPSFNGRPQYHSPQLFDDVSMQPQPQIPIPAATTYEGQPYNSFPTSQPISSSQSTEIFNPALVSNNPVAGVAFQYGSQLAGQGTDIFHKNVEKYVSSSKIKYYFAVDTNYVGRKLGILLFPFLHKDWSVKYDETEDNPVAPRFDVNAPDLYIPVMAFVTYILTAGFSLGLQNRFTPEHLSIQSSTALVFLCLEIFLIWLSKYLMNVAASIKYLDLIAYCGYKYFGMIICMLTGIVFQSLGYYISLFWTSASVAFFLIRTLKMKIEAASDTSTSHIGIGRKRTMYLILIIAGLQPILMWWLTRNFVIQTVSTAKTLRDL